MWLAFGTETRTQRDMNRQIIHGRVQKADRDITDNHLFVEVEADW